MEFKASALIAIDWAIAKA